MFMSLSWIKKYMSLDFWFNLAWMATSNLPPQNWLHKIRSKKLASKTAIKFSRKNSRIRKKLFNIKNFFY